MGLYSHLSSSPCIPQTSNTTESCHLQTCSDDSVSGGRETVYRELVNRFVAYCGNNQLLNMAKTKEMVVDFRRTRIKLNTISILGEEVEVVEGYRYLGGHLDNSLEWKCNT